MPIYFKNQKIDGVIVGTASGSTAGATLSNSSDLRAGLVAYGRYGQVTGTMQDLPSTIYTPGTTNQTITAGKYIAGIQTILGDSNLVAGNIKSGVTIFGVTGSYAGGTASLQTKSVTPTKLSQTITADSGYDGLSSVTVAAIPGEYITTSDANATAAHILTNKTAYVNGTKITGEMRNIGGVTETLAINGSYTIPEGYHDGTGSISQNLATKAAATYNVSTSNQTIAANQYLTGAQTIRGVTVSNLTAANIRSGVTVTVGDSANASRITSVTGTYGGSGGTTINNQDKTIIPSESQQLVTADTGYTGLGVVTVNPIPSDYITTSDATATANDILYMKTAYVDGNKITGNIPRISSTTIANPPDVGYTNNIRLNGYYDNAGIRIEFSSEQAATITPGNIKAGVDILGVTGTYSGAGVNLQSKTITPTKSQQSVTADSGYDALSSVTVNAIPASYITTTDATATAANILSDKTAYVNGSKITGTMTNNGATGGTISTQDGTYTIPAGYTSGGTVTASLPTGSTTAANISGAAFEETTGDYGFRTSVQIQPGYYASATTVTKDFSSMLPAPDTEGTAAQVLAGYDLYNHNGELISGTMTNNSIGTITLDQTTTSYTIPAGYHNGTGKVQHTTVNIPDPTIIVSSGGLITASGSWTRGFTTDNSYSSTNQLSTQAAKTVTPTESSQTAVASGKYTTGAVTVAAIPSDYVGSDITERSSSDLTASGATVTVPAGYYPSQATKSVTTMTLPTAVSSSSVGSNKLTINRSTSVQYINIPQGYNSTASYYTISAVANGLVTAPASISGTTATVSTGTNTLTLTKTVSVTPNVTTAGYISSGTAGNSSVSLTASVTTKAAATYRASTSSQTIAAGTYLTGAQTIAAVSQTNLSAANIKAGTTISVSNGSSNIWSVAGTYTSDATATAADIIADETAYVNGSKITGTLVVNKYYTGSTAPSSSLGNNGDIYLQR